MKDPAGQTPNTPQDPPNTPDPASGPPVDPPGRQDPPANSGSGEKAYTKDELEAIVKDRLERERKSAERKAEKDKASAQQQALESQQEWEKLANQRKAVLDTLQPRAELADKYETALNTYVTKEREGLPASVVSLLDKMDYADQIEWIANNKAEFTQPVQDPTAQAHEARRPARLGVDATKAAELQGYSEDPRVAIEQFNASLRQRLPGG